MVVSSPVPEVNSTLPHHAQAVQVDVVVYHAATASATSIAPLLSPPVEQRVRDVLQEGETVVSIVAFILPAKLTATENLNGRRRQNLLFIWRKVKSEEQ